MDKIHCLTVHGLFREYFVFVTSFNGLINMQSVVLCNMFQFWEIAIYKYL